MKLKTWAPAILAIVLGGGAAMLFRNMMLKPRAPVAATSRTIQVAIAAEDLIVGQELRAENLSTSAVPTPDKPIDYCMHPAELVGRVLTSPVLKGQSIKESNLAPLGASGNLMTHIPAGMRAMTIPVDEGNSQAGMLLPGCHVDVVGTFPNGRKSVTRTLVKNVLVQAVGTRLTSASSPDGKDPGPYHTVTLIVTEREAKTIDLTTNSGRMRLLLRGLTRSDNEGDTKDVSMKDITPDGDDIVPVGAPATRPAGPETAEVPPQQQKYRVELIKGGTTTIVDFPNIVRPQEAGGADMQRQQIPGSDVERE